MIHPKQLVFLLLAALVAAITAAGCASVERQVVRLTPTTASDDSNSAALPQATSGSSLPTPTPTQAVVYLPTGTRTPTPTWAPTSTPTPTPTTTPAPQQAPAIPAQESAAVSAAPANSEQIEHVVVISIDGLRPDALELADTPALDSLRRQGSYSPNAQAVVPSVTLINHASMLGGMLPAKHGIDWNDDDPGRGKINGPTMFSEVRQAGHSAVMVVGKPKLEHLVLDGSVDNYFYAGYTDYQVSDQALSVINGGLPNLLFVHLPGVDTAGHLTGWMSPGQLLAINQADGVVGSIVAALDNGDYLPSTLLIVTSDHGGSGTAHGSASPEDTTIPWLAVGPGVPAGVTIPSAIVTYDTAATVLRAFNLPIPPTWDGKAVADIFN